MRLLALVVLLSLAAPPLALAEDYADDYAAKIEAAFDGAKLDQIVQLAKRAHLDPWRVADALCMRGACEAAIIYAEAIHHPDAARLPAYVKHRNKHGHVPAARAAIRLGALASTPKSAPSALEALDKQRGRGDALERVIVEVLRGNALMKLRRYTEAGEAYTTGGRTAERLGWLLMAASAYRAAGNSSHRRGDLEGKLAAWSRMLYIQRIRGDAPGIGRALTFVGNAHHELGNYDLALQHLRQAEVQYRELKDARHAAWVLDNVADVLQMRGEYSRAQVALTRALEYARAVKDGYREAQVLSNLGRLLNRLHDLEPALARHAEALAYFQRVDSKRGIAQCVGNLGNVYGRLGELEKALEHVQRALSAYRELKDKYQIVVGLVSLGRIQLARGKTQESKAALGEALDLARGMRSGHLEAHAQHELAAVHIHEKDFKAAQVAIDQGLHISARQKSAPLLMESHRLQADLWFARGQPGRAVDASARAIEYTLAQLVGLAQGQAAIARDSMQHLFEVSLRSAVAWKRPTAVFASIEAAKAGALLESLENREQIRNEHVSDALRERERDENRALVASARVYRQALASADYPRTRAAGRELEKAHKRLNRVIGEIQREARANLLYPVAAELPDMQALLAPDEVLISFSLLTDSAVAIVVSSKKARVVDLGPSDELIAAAEVTLDDPDVNPKKALAHLRKLLIKPLKLGSRVRRLLIAPDQILGYVPFSLLVGTRAIAMVPSASSYIALRALPTERGRGVLALGDPDYAVATSTDMTLASRGGMDLTPLPASGEEVRAVASTKDDVLLLGKQATADRFLRTVGTRKRWRAIHLACHGRIDSARPMRSALALAFDSKGSGLLTFSDVLRRKLPADLTVLSACETGRGALYRVEGIVGLTQAFMLAGSPRVLVSLWKVDDDATRALMIEFYKLWRGGTDTAVALRQAQEHVRTDSLHPAWKHPYYWAAWVLWGLPN